VIVLDYRLDGKDGGGRVSGWCGLRYWEPRAIVEGGALRDQR